LALIHKDNNEMVLNNTYRDFENELKKIKNIGKINKFGVPQKQVLIELDPYKMNQYGFSAFDVIQSLSLNLQNFPGGAYYQNATNYNVIGFGEIKDLNELKKHSLIGNDYGNKTTLGQLADIRFHLQPEEHFFKLDNRPALIFEIRRNNQTDYINLAKDIISLSKKYKKNDCEVVVFENNTRYLEKRINALNSNLITGFILVFISLYIFLGRKVSVFVSLGIPFSFAGTVIVMHFMHMSINALSLSGFIIILGMIVDDTVTIADNVYRHHENGKPLRQACIDGTLEIIGGVFMSYLTTMVSFLPLAFIPGTTGAILKDMPIVVMICMTISILEGILIFPGHLLKFKESKNLFIKKTNELNNQLNQLIQKGIDKALKFNKVFLGIVLGLALISVFYMGSLTYVIFPEEAIETFYILTESKADVTLSQNASQLKIVEKIIEQMPKGTVKNYVTSHGVNGLFNKHFRNTQIGKKYSQISLYLTPKENRKLNISTVMNIMEKELKASALFSDIQVVQEVLGPPTDKSLIIDIMGDDLELSNKWSKEIYSQLQKEKGVINLTYNANQFEQETKLLLNQNKIAQYQLSGAQVLAELRAGLDGFPLNAVSMIVDEEPLPIVVSTKKIEGNLQHYLNTLSVNNRKGGMIALSNLTKIETSQSPAVIFHRDHKRAVRIEADTNPKITSGVKVRQKYIDKYQNKLPQNIKINENRIILDEEENIQAMSKALTISFLLNFFCLLVYYHSISKPLLVLA
jgi:multidrug efflux pump subunit AcrB